MLSFLKKMWISLSIIPLLMIDLMNTLISGDSLIESYNETMEIIKNKLKKHD